MSGDGESVLDRVAGVRIPLADAYETERRRVRVLAQIVKILAAENAKPVRSSAVYSQIARANHLETQRCN